ncbi:MAG TPA: PIG-L family deacetylase, partial [Ilumatobacteraceae bacterium]|nr:PIG-L family deacetylase [Ilumatobacteraceae bacterium]
RGDRVVLVSATLGEHGTSDPATWPPDRLAARRRRELAASLAELGVHEHQVLGYEDGTCHTVDGTPMIAYHLAEIQPDVIVTFGPDGMTGHLDHRAVSAWTTEAWRASDSRAELWYATVTPRFHAEWRTVNDEIGLWSDQPEPPSTDDSELCHAIELTDAQLDSKMAALAAHGSQTVPLLELMGAAAYRRWWATESFRAAAREPAFDEQQSADAFSAWPALR